MYIRRRYAPGEEGVTFRVGVLLGHFRAAACEGEQPVLRAFARRGCGPHGCSRNRIVQVTTAQCFCEWSGSRSCRRRESSPSGGDSQPSACGRLRTATTSDEVARCSSSNMLSLSRLWPPPSGRAAWAHDRRVAGAIRCRAALQPTVSTSHIPLAALRDTAQHSSRLVYSLFPI